MVEAQTLMETPTLIALMLLAALVGYAVDQALAWLNDRLTRWRHA